MHTTLTGGEKKNKKIVAARYEIHRGVSAATEVSEPENEDEEE
jgi:hypothetical protein